MLVYNKRLLLNTYGMNIKVRNPTSRAFIILEEES